MKRAAYALGAVALLAALGCCAPRHRYAGGARRGARLDGGAQRRLLVTVNFGFEVIS
jgi:hypothetical protein